MLESTIMQSKTRVRFLQLACAALAFFFLASACSPDSRLPQLTPAAVPSITATPNLIQRQTMAAANATPTPIPSPTPWPVATATPSSILIKDLAAEGLNPLTGLPADDENLLQQRPVLVKIANWPQGLRPAAGLNQADLVFEYYIGAQTNHFLAVYHGQDSEQVGPLAPARMVDARLSEHYQGVLAYASADNTVEQVLSEVLPGRSFVRGFTSCPAMCNLSDAGSENTYVNTGALRELHQAENPDGNDVNLSGLSFASRVSQWDAEAQQLSYLYADFSVMQWDYDSQSRQYQLSQDYADPDGTIRIAPSNDRVDGIRIAFDNVVILFASYFEYGPTRYDIDFREGDPHQPALVFRDGKLLYGTWMAPDPFSPIQLFDTYGQPLALKPGRTWIVFTGTKSPTSEVEPGIWEITFSLN
ncbi:MAG TPA: hypothetical protein DCG78_00575 [Anaerolineaceae bacterium]|nr:hypothetical protein [Anaerolineaceae bacterium]